MVARGSGDDGTKLIVSDHRAHHDYFLDERYEAGLVLQGTEVKSLRGEPDIVDRLQRFRQAADAPSTELASRCGRFGVDE